MQKRLYRNLIVLVFANLIIKPIWVFGVDLAVQNSVPSVDYGKYFILFNFSFLFHILLDLGINQYANKEVAQNNELVYTEFVNLLRVKILFSFVYVVISILAAFLFFSNSVSFFWLLLLLANQIFISLMLYIRSYFTALQWNYWNAFFSILDRFISIIFVASLLYFWLKDSFVIEYFIIAQTLALAISFFSAMSVVLIELKLPFTFISNSKVVEVLKKSIPYALIVFFMTAYTRVDAIMLKLLLPLHGAKEAAIYAAGYRILDMINMLPFLIASILLPFFAQKSLSKKLQDSVIKQCTLFMIFISIPVACFSYYYGNDLVNLLYNKQEFQWIYTFKILICTFIAVSVGYVYGSFLTAKGALKLLIYYSIATLFFNIIFNTILIPKYGALGAATTTLLCQSLMATLQLIYVHSKWKVKIYAKEIIGIFFYIISIILLMKILSQSNCLLIIQILIAIFGTILLSLATGVLPIKELKSLK